MRFWDRVLCGSGGYVNERFYFSEALGFSLWRRICVNLDEVDVRSRLFDDLSFESGSEK